MKRSDLIPGIDLLTDRQADELGPSMGLGKTKANTKNIYERMTDRIIQIMDKNVELPWRKPWGLSADGELAFPKNFSTKKNYRGANLFFLYMEMMDAGYLNPYFMTFKQAEKAGGMVKQGQKGVPIVFYTKDLYRHSVTKKTISKKKYQSLAPSQKANYEASWTLRSFTVFNGEQIDGIDFGNDFVPVELPEFQQVERAEEVLKNAPNLPPISHGGSSAFYVPAQDRIQMPNPKAFEKEPFYYSTLFHEIIHSTGSPNRLDREEKKKRKSWGDSFYAYEELIAEMGAVYLNGYCDIDYFTLNNSAAYLKSWKSQVKNYLSKDPKFFFNAAGHAQKAADYVLGEAPASVYKKFDGKAAPWKGNSSKKTNTAQASPEAIAEAQAQRIRIMLLA